MGVNLTQGFGTPFVIVCWLIHVQIWIQQNLTDRCGLSQYKLRNGVPTSLLKGNNQVFFVSRLARLS